MNNSQTVSSSFDWSSHKRVDNTHEWITVTAYVFTSAYCKVFGHVQHTYVWVHINVLFQVWLCKYSSVLLKFSNKYERCLNRMCAFIMQNKSFCNLLRDMKILKQFERCNKLCPRFCVISTYLRIFKDYFDWRNFILHKTGNDRAKSHTDQTDQRNYHVI